MTRNDKRSPESIAIRLSTWSPRHRSWLAGRIRIYIFIGTALLFLLAFAGVISFLTAVFTAFSCSLITMGLAWTLIQHRKTILLNIQEPVVRDQAYKAMLVSLQEDDDSRWVRSTHPPTPATRAPSAVCKKRRIECTPSSHLRSEIGSIWVG